MIELIDVTLTRGSFCLRETSLLIPAGHCGTIVGAAGAGKTSIVEAICGLQSISSGQIKLRDQIVSTPQSTAPQSYLPGARNVGYLPQDLVLFPDLTVAENIAFGPKVHRWSKPKIAATITSLAETLRLADLLNRKPDQLSGGQQKRVALARSIALGSDIVCLDEPFVSLDEESRTMVRNLLHTLVKDKTVTLLVVTHQPQWMDGIPSIQFDLSGQT